jgi:hypothetical protein
LFYSRTREEIERLLDAPRALPGEAKPTVRRSGARRATNSTARGSVRTN